MKHKLLLIGLALAIPAITQAAVSIGVEGSSHDMSTNAIGAAWNTRHNVCAPCHTAHWTDPSQIIPLWSHKTTTTTFTPYSSPSLDAVVGTPSGVSLACLSCHDGTLGVNEAYGKTLTGTNVPIYVATQFQLGGDGNLHTIHPISFTYDSALAAADGGLEDPSTYKIGDTKTLITMNTPPVPTVAEYGEVITGKTIDQALLTGGKLECNSCHDQHKTKGWSPESGSFRILGSRLVDASGRGDLLCRTCHIK